MSPKDRHCLVSVSLLLIILKSKSHFVAVLWTIGQEV